MNPEVVYLPDDSIDAELDQELRGLLRTCFTKPEDIVFESRRYWREPYKHRWVIRNEEGRLVAHIGVHEKTVEADGKTFRVGGICEVCVRPEYRGRGYVRAMLECVHAWMSGHDFVFSMLFGDPKVYGSSGYVEVDNLYTNEAGEGWKSVEGMIKQTTDSEWPIGDVHLVGLKF